jgi:hypothetical protein
MHSALHSSRSGRHGRGAVGGRGGRRALAALLLQLLLGGGTPLAAVLVSRHLLHSRRRQVPRRQAPAVRLRQDACMHGLSSCTRLDLEPRAPRMQQHQVLSMLIERNGSITQQC